MAFAQLTYRESLRDIEACLSAQATKLYHMGFREPVRRSTLADANESSRGGGERNRTAARPPRNAPVHHPLLAHRLIAILGNSTVEVCFRPRSPLDANSPLTGNLLPEVP